MSPSAAMAAHGPFFGDDDYRLYRDRSPKIAVPPG
jgi:hypothetical protein